jgi:hypothetical protein
MSMRSILLRVLLSLTLALNGASAAAMMTSVHAAHPTMVASVATSGHAMPCHGHSHVSAAEMRVHHAMADAASATTRHSIPDCCKHGACSCDCTLVAQVVFSEVYVPLLMLDRSRSAGRLSVSHGAPALPHLIRPPIG